MAESSLTGEVHGEGSLEEQISALVQEMNSLNGAIGQERHANRMLKVDYEYTMEQKAKLPTAKLESTIETATDENEKLRKERSAAERKYAKMVLEAAKSTNPKLLPLKKKLFSLHTRQQEINEAMTRLDQYRAQLSHEYTRMTHSFKNEGKIKAQIKKLHDIVTAKDELIAQLRQEQANLKLQIQEFDVSSPEKREIAYLHDKFRKYNDKIDEQKNINSGLTEKADDMQKQIEDLKSGKSTSKYETGDVRSELRRLEQEITVRTEEIKMKEHKRLQLQVEIQQKKEELEEFNKAAPRRSIMKSPNSPNRQSPGSPKGRATIVLPGRDSVFSLSPLPANNASPVVSVYSPTSAGRSAVSPKSQKSYRSRATTSYSRKKRNRVTEEERKRAQMIQDVESSVHTGEISAIAQIVKSFGKPGQGLASKLIEINRTQLNKGT